MQYLISEQIYIDENSSNCMIKWALLKFDGLKGRMSPVLMADTRELLLQAIEDRFEIDILETKKAQIESKINPEILKALKSTEVDI